MSRTTISCAITAVLACASTLIAVRLTATAQPAPPALIENGRVRVTQLAYQPGVARPRGIRPADQVIVFLDDCRYERTDPVRGEKTVRVRKSGDVIWHSKGEDAPVLVNAGAAPYRTVLIDLK